MDRIARNARPVGVGLVAYGASGLLLLAALGAAIGPALAVADAFARSSSEASVALRASVDALDGLATSLREARGSTDRAADATRQASSVARDLAERMSIGIFGVQPLLPVAEGFRRQSSELDALARELSRLTMALGRNEIDLAALRSSAAVIRDRIGALEAGDAPVAGMGVTGLAYLLLAWASLLPIASIAAGVALLRGAPIRS